jgi:hypothetical protein
MDGHAAVGTDIRDGAASSDHQVVLEGGLVGRLELLRRRIAGPHQGLGRGGSYVVQTSEDRPRDHVPSAVVEERFSRCRDRWRQPDVDVAPCGIRVGKEAYTTVDRDVADLDALATTHNAESTLEAAPQTHSQELFRVRAASLAADLLRRAELHIQGAVIRAPVTACPTARDYCLRCVQNSRHLGLDSQDHIPQTVDCPNVELELRPGGDLMIAVDRLADLSVLGKQRGVTRDRARARRRAGEWDWSNVAVWSRSRVDIDARRVAARTRRRPRSGRGRLLMELFAEPPQGAPESSLCSRIPVALPREAQRCRV